MLASDYPLLDLLWTLGILLLWLWLLVKVGVDIVRKWRFGGPVVKALWIVFVILLQLLGVWVYLVTRVTVDDLLPRSDLGDGAKVLWILGFVFLPIVGVIVYLLTQRAGMTERGTSLAKIAGVGEQRLRRERRCLIVLRQRSRNSKRPPLRKREAAVYLYATLTP